MKIKLVFAFLCLFALVIVIRLYYIQVTKGEYFEALALGQQVSFEEIGGQRGEVFFNNGEILAQTKKTYLAYVFPDKVTEIQRLNEILGEDISSLKDVFKREIDKQDLDLLTDIDGVEIDQVWTRVYPQNKIASHVLGFINQEGEGQYGIEGYYDDVLKGRQGFNTKGKSPFGYSLFSDSGLFQSYKGTDIYLTLDYNIQYLAEKLLEQAKEDWNISSGQIIVSEPVTGKIIAMANYPRFDPNQYSQYYVGMFVNPAVQMLFEPGSVFKPFTMAQGLEQGMIEPDTTYIDEGSVKVGGPAIYNFQKRIWGEQSMTDVLEESINTGAVYVQDLVGRETFLRYLGQFGLYEKTYIDLQGETYSVNETLRNGYPRDIATASFGQGIQITPVQMIKAFSAIANQGKLMRPYIVEKAKDNNGNMIFNEPVEEGKVISPTTCQKLTSMLMSVVENGSARGTQIKGYHIAAKTGTAQVPLTTGGYSETQTIQSFIGFFPALEPQYLIMVKLDNPESLMAGHSVAPIFKQLAKYIIDYKEIPPTY